MGERKGEKRGVWARETRKRREDDKRRKKRVERRSTQQ